MRILLKVVFYAALIGAIALVVYALVADLPAPERDIVIPVSPQ